MSFSSPTSPTFHSPTGNVKGPAQGGGLAGYNQVLPAAQNRVTTTENTRQNAIKTNDHKQRQRSLYERVIGKSAQSTQAVKPKKQSVGSTIASWFSKETPEERLVRATLRNYRAMLQAEIVFVQKAIVRHRRRLLDLQNDFDKQDRQLVAWGLKTTLGRYRIQAWCRYARTSLQLNLSEEIDVLLSERIKKTSIYIQLFEDTYNRKDKFSLTSIESFCKAVESLIKEDFDILCMLESFQRLEITCGIVAKQFALLESRFTFKTQDQRKQLLYSILRRYAELPDLSELDNVETDLTWEDFCKWVTHRTILQRSIERDFSDFVEDQREKEEKGKHRANSQSPMVRVSQDSVDNAGDGAGDFNGAGDGANPANFKKPSVLRVTPASIKAFVRYFAVDILAQTYSVGKGRTLVALIELTESLFYRRIGTVVMTYPSLHTSTSLMGSLPVYNSPAPALASTPPTHTPVHPPAHTPPHSSVDTVHPAASGALLTCVEGLDEAWRVQVRKCRFLDPLSYHVPPSYFKVTSPGVDGHHVKEHPGAGVGSGVGGGVGSGRAGVVSGGDVGNDVGSGFVGVDSTAPIQSHTIVSVQDAEGEVRQNLHRVLHQFDAIKAENYPQPEQQLAGDNSADGSTAVVEASHNSRNSHDTMDMHMLHRADSRGSSNSRRSSRVSSRGAMGDNELTDIVEQIVLGIDTAESAAGGTSSPVRTGPLDFSAEAVAATEEEVTKPVGSHVEVEVDGGDDGEEEDDDEDDEDDVDIDVEEGIGHVARKSLGPPPTSPTHTNMCMCSVCAEISYFRRILGPGHSSSSSSSSSSSGAVSGVSAASAVPTAPASSAVSASRYGGSYLRTSRVLTWMANTTVPREMVWYLTLACKWILRDAIDASGSRSILGADVLIPLFTLALIHSHIPHIHLILYILYVYGDYEEQGDVGYNVASLEGSVACIMGFTLSAQEEEEWRKTSQGGGSDAVEGLGLPMTASACATPNTSVLAETNNSNNSAPKASVFSMLMAELGLCGGGTSAGTRAEDMKAMEELGEWIRDQQTMEDTIEILQKDGWML
eukprot:gene26625-32174_t